MTVLVISVFAAAGLLAGLLARLVLARLRRGALVAAPRCEIAVGVLWALSGWRWLAGVVPVGWLPLLLGLGWLTVAAAVVDLAHHRLPDALTLPALPVGLLLACPLGAETVLRAAAGAAVLVAVHAAVHVAAPAAIGAGDVKLAGALGVVLAASSWPAVPLGALAAALLTGIVATLGVLTGRLGRGDGVPHGPSMLAAGWLVAAGTGVG